MRKDLKNVEGGTSKKEQTLKIPKGWFVREVDLDCEKPYCIISDGGHLPVKKDKRLLIPESLAYYMTVHFSGSKEMDERNVAQGRYEIQDGIKKLLKT